MSRTFLLKITAVCIGIVISLCLAEVFLRVQDFIQLDGFAEDKRWNSVLHHGYDTFAVKTYGTDCVAGKKKILLLGDSWMEDPVLSGTIGRQLSVETGQCLQVVNGGTSSYAPSLYLLKARQAFQVYGPFDSIVVNIDETDIGDEWLRYRIPSTRDASGKLVAVPFEKDIRSLFIWNGKLWAEDSSFYVIRFFKFALFYNVLFPYMERFTVAPNHYDTLMKYVFSTKPAMSFSAERSYFDDRLAELAAELIDMANAANSVYITHHPHWRGLVDTVDKGNKYLPVISEAIAKLGRDSGVTVLDARYNIGEIHGKELLVNTFVEEDPFSHLAAEGATRYGNWIAAQISSKESR